MIELKARRIDNIISAYKIGKAFCMKTEEEVYIKSEADKVIEDKDKEIAELKAMLEERNKQVGELKDSLELSSNECCSISERSVKRLRHHKYKRCLAMASCCSDKASAEYASSYVSCDEYYYHHAEFWVKWSKRWLELAEKFKEAKNGWSVRIFRP